MFNMKEIGKRIAKLRKENNMTQVELADKLGISYQAVSNWERGDSMPDISKLSELSQIFDTSIDEILGNEREAKIINDIIEEETIDLNSVSEDELKNLLPIVKPEQFKKSFTDFDDMKFEQLIILAPFLEEEQIDEIVLTKFRNLDSAKWIALAPFMSEDAVTMLFNDGVNKNDSDLGWLVGLAPFVKHGTLNDSVYALYKKRGINTIVALAPFVDAKIIRKIYDEEIEKGNYTAVIVLIPFLKGEEFKDIFKGFKFK
ncbi:helix-turn-helix domain-containing protein [Haploplasma axanthum]|uniref:HTH-type transcriptional regulator immR n=1 Tax=Haploplasma axanthum TaxID=29552 RepID=A0A449BCZ3_HAPAX|nr:helix-turn-helix transcriptional regulator [Haploplasma axanthum]VEU80319.1 HTH-type transcriptional regulator immR [Haploplasma axanthum]